MAANGALGERYAAQCLRDAGYNIVAQNFFTRAGEIDIIASKGDILAFVEVKTRSEGALDTPAAAVGAAKQRKIIGAAQAFLAQYPGDWQPRFDVFELVLARGSHFCVLWQRHLEGAFDAST